MTERLYYADSYTTTFEATVVERLDHDGHTALVLDRTYFYPLSGGQPADAGTINGVPVEDVYIREADGAVVHVLSADLLSDEVEGVIDWERRFDHMQQHTGQHILSQAFIQAADAHTVSFHLSDNSVTIDLDKEQLRPEEVEQAELLANQIIWEDRPIHVRQVSTEEAERLALRKVPELEADKLRLIEIEQFDVTACGGTHVSRSGAVGMIKIVKLERRRNQLRVEFCCGRRALLDYGHKNRVVNNLANELTTGYWELEGAVANLREENKELRRENRRQQSETMGLLAEKLLAEAAAQNGTRIIKRAFDDRGPDEVRTLASQIAETPGAIALLGLSGEKSQLIFARAKDAPGQMNELLKPALQILGSAGGGGSATYAQGGGPAADLERLQQALNRAERLLLAQLH
jgi:alanyl-tRNA synthetase